MRNSNIELLRILCMFMIILWHLNIAVEQNGVSPFILKDTIYSLTAVAVNCFILISGYWGIRFKLKSIITLFLQCLFYSIVTGLCVHYITGAHWDIIKILLPISTNQWWFITTYIMLYLSAPLLNKAIENTKNLSYNILAFSLICVYFGYIFKNPNNSSGHSYLQFVFIYIIGRSTYKYLQHNDELKHEKLQYLVGGGNLADNIYNNVGH